MIRSVAQAPEIVSDTIANDTIVINIKTGAYYSLTEAGAEAWKAMLEGKPSEQHLGVYLGLAKEGLISCEVDDSEGAEVSSPQEVFEKYTDMESLLLADPIHEVDSQGWPKLK